jgi:hypothetical protein
VHRRAAALPATQPQPTSIISTRTAPVAVRIEVRW